MLAFECPSVRLTKMMFSPDAMRIDTACAAFAAVVSSDLHSLEEIDGLIDSLA